MPNEPQENGAFSKDIFSDDILNAFQAYPKPSPSKGFEARFWNEFEERRDRYLGLKGALRRVWELEIEGVLVWRLAASTLTGGLSCFVLLAVFCTSSGQPASPLPSKPASDIPPSNLTALAFYNREWERELTAPKSLPKSAPPRAPQKTKEFSWTFSSANLA